MYPFVSGVLISVFTLLG